jgi:hypothetical protein
MKKALELRFEDKTVAYYIWCQGCKCAHCFPVTLEYYSYRMKGRTGKLPIWTFSGTLEKPTFSPSLRHYYNKPPNGEEITTCHIIVTNGQIQFCADCPFELKGQTLDLETIPAHYSLPAGVIR